MSKKGKPQSQSKLVLLNQLVKEVSKPHIEKTRSQQSEQKRFVLQTPKKGLKFSMKKEKIERNTDKQEASALVKSQTTDVKKNKSGVFMVEFKYLQEGYNGTFIEREGVRISQFCIKHNTTISQFLYREIQGSAFHIGLCPSCAVYLAKKGYEVEELLTEIPSNRREQDLSSFMSGLKQLMFHFKEMLRTKRTVQKKIFEEFFQKKFKLERAIMMMFEELEIQFQIVVEHQQRKFDEINQQRKIQDEEIMHCIEDLCKIQKDIENNYQSIVNTVEEQSFENILGYLRTRCENLKLFQERYKAIPNISFEEVDYDKVVTMFKNLFANFVEQNLLSRESLNRPSKPEVPFWEKENKTSLYSLRNSFDERETQAKQRFGEQDETLLKNESFIRRGENSFLHSADEFKSERPSVQNRRESQS